MPFLEVEFPRTISAKALGGPGFLTTVNEGFSGFEQRNRNWSIARGSWIVTLHTPGTEFASAQQFIDQLQAFFYNAGGRYNGFRLKDHKDYTNGSSAQFIGTGDGSTGIFQLTKAYVLGGGAYSYLRTIWKPMTSLVVDYLGNALSDTVGVTVGGVAQTFNAGYVDGNNVQMTIDETQGIVCFGAASVWTITSVSMSGTVMTCAYTVVSGNAPYKNQNVTISGLSSVNNGTFLITSTSPTSSTQGTFTVTNADGASQSPTTGKGVVAKSILSITAASQSGSTTTYSYVVSSGAVPAVGMRATISGLADAGNNGVFYISAASGGSTGTFSVNNASGVTASGQSGTGYTDWVPAANALIYATFQFHFPVRFDTDKLDIQLDESDVRDGYPIVSWNSITLRELRLTAGQG